MSSQYINQGKKQYQISGRMKDLVLDGACDVSGTISGVNQILSGVQTIGGDFNLVGDTLTAGKVALPALTNYVQPTAANANVAASTGGVAPQQFMISTFESSAGVGGDIAAGASVTFTVFHSGIVAGKTMVLCSKAGSANGLFEVTDYVSATAANEFTVTRHNHGSTTASGTQQLIFKLIHTV